MSLHATGVGVDLVVLLQYFMTSAPGRAKGAVSVIPYVLHTVRFSSADLAKAIPTPPSLLLEAELGNSPPAVAPEQVFRTHLGVRIADRGCALALHVGRAPAPSDSSSQL